jgi:hypothetical protein
VFYTFKRKTVTTALVRADTRRPAITKTNFLPVGLLLSYGGAAGLKNQPSNETR